MSRLARRRCDCGGMAWGREGMLCQFESRGREGGSGWSRPLRRCPHLSIRRRGSLAARQHLSACLSFERSCVMILYDERPME